MLNLSLTDGSQAEYLTSGHKKSFDRLEELVDRVQKLENSISVLSTRGSASANTSPRSMRKRELSSSPYPKSPSPAPKRPRSRTSDTSEPSIPDFSTPTEEAVRMLEVGAYLVFDGRRVTPS